MSRLRRWSEGVLEASWLVAAAVTPLLFSTHTGVLGIPFGFEPSKVLLVRVLALLMAAAWLVGRLEASPGADEPRARWRTPLTLPLLAYVGALCIGAFFSLAPTMSFRGGSVRLDGVLTLAAYLVVFSGLAARLRRPESLRRLFDVLVVTSVPVCLYSLAQAAGVDPIDWLGNNFEEGGRAFSTLGNPIFAGAYLVLLLPLTLASGLDSWRAPRGRWRSAVCAAALVLQLVALTLTVSRGPWIAAVAGLVSFGVLAGSVGRRRLWTALAFAPAVGFGLFVLVLNVPRGPLEPLREKPALRRLAHLFDRATPSLSGRSRYLIWKSALELVRPRPPLVDGEGRPDRFHRLRPLVGYGMEAFSLAFPAVYDPEFARIERRHHLQSEEPLERQEEPPPSADRSHNEFWDSVAFAGWLGGVTHILFYGSILGLALRVLGLSTGSRRWCFQGYLGIGGLLAGLAVSDAFGWPYLGVALPFGLAAAFIAHALLATFRGGAREGPTPWLAVGIAAALLGNLIEVHLGLAVATGRLYFWILAGLLSAVFLDPSILERAEEPEAKGESLLRASAPAGLLGAAFMITLLFDFVKPSSLGFVATLAALLGGKRGPGQLAVLGIGLATVGLLIALQRRKLRPALLALGLSLGVACLFAAIQIQTITAVRDLKNDLPSLEAFARWLLPQYVLFLAALTLGIGAALAGQRAGEPVSIRGRAGVACASIALFAAILLAWPAGLSRSEAESLVQVGALFERSSRFPVAAGLFERASEIDPREARYALYLGRVALKASRLPLPPAEGTRWLDLAEEAFQRARVLSPYDPGHVWNLARLEVRRSEVAIPGQDESYEEQAEGLYQRTLRMSPANVVLRNECALFQLLRRRKLDEAEQNLKRSLEIDPDYFYTYTALGQVYVTRGQSGGDKIENYRRAISFYERSLAMQFSARTAVSLALLSLEVEDKPTSVRRLENALRFQPAPEAARKVHAHLARLYQELGQPDKAAAHAGQARPPS